MSITSEPSGEHLEDRTGHAPDGHDGSPTLTAPRLRWPVVQALRAIGGEATLEEIAEKAADSLSLAHQQRTERTASGKRTKLLEAVMWAALQLKHIGVLHYPRRGYRALTPLGLEVDEEQVDALRASYEADRPSSVDPTDPTDPTEGEEQSDAPTAWLIRASKGGERSDYNIEQGLAAISFGQLPDLGTFSSRQHLADALRRHFPDYSGASIANRAGQLWRFRTDVRVGDLVVMPRMTQEIAIGAVTREYWYDDRDPDPGWRHIVSVDWKRTDVPRTALEQDLLHSLGAQMTICAITRHDAPWRLQRVLETGRDPGPRTSKTAGSSESALDLPDLVEQFCRKTGYPTDADEEQRRLREEWAEKLAPENVASLSREDLLAYMNNGVRDGMYVNPREGVRQKWIVDLDDVQYVRLLDSIRELCWGEDEVSTRIGRLVDEVGGSNRDTGTKSFSGIQVSRTLAICFPERFFPMASQIGKWGRQQSLRALGLPEPQGSYGQRVVDANDRLREHLAPHFDDDPLAIAAFLYWLRGQETASGSGDEPGDEASDLSILVERFRAESGYPTDVHREQERLRIEWAEKLEPENIADFSRHDLTAVASHGTWNRAMYVYPNPTGVIRWVAGLDQEGYSRLLDHIRYLCWDDDELWVRYDQITDSRSGRRTKGLKNETASRLLAICHPEDVLPIGTQGGRWSREAMLNQLGLPEPRGTSHGQRVLDANDRLIEHLEPHFGDDTLGMGAFLEWLLQQEQPGRPADLAELADELLIEEKFLKDIVSLLEDKGQVILYGPPGTGKTFLARALADALAPDESCRMLVQFHPSTSYEDFFEGYRPAGTGEGGNIRYVLAPGPLARMAEQASETPGRRHVMIIDEINRGNLPRVLGELLFLLEYRDEAVQTLYRPEEPFSLPANLWFIGTMNTADRSIALVDAALRRRFHFVPFFPDSGPMAGLLGRWLEREGEPAWVGALVDGVNDDLKEVLEGSHLLLGPSHFMKEYGSSLDTQRARLRRIWEYNIEPFIEDQFFGDPDQIRNFRFDAVMRRNGPAAESDVDAGDGGDDTTPATLGQG